MNPLTARGFPGHGRNEPRGGDEHWRTRQAGLSVRSPTIFSLLALLAWGTLLVPVSGRAAGQDGCGSESRTSPLRPDYATREFDSVRQLQKQGDILPLREVLAHARGHRPGRVLDTRLESERHRYVYAIELVDDGGQVWELKLDASTAELLEDHRED